MKHVPIVLALTLSLRPASVRTEEPVSPDHAQLVVESMVDSNVNCTQHLSGILGIHWRQKIP